MLFMSAAAVEKKAQTVISWLFVNFWPLDKQTISYHVTRELGDTFLLLGLIYRTKVDIFVLEINV